MGCGAHGRLLEDPSDGSHGSRFLQLFFGGLLEIVFVIFDCE